MPGAAASVFALTLTASRFPFRSWISAPLHASAGVGSSLRFLARVGQECHLHGDHKEAGGQEDQQEGQADDPTSVLPDHFVCYLRRESLRPAKSPTLRPKPAMSLTDRAKPDFGGTLTTDLQPVWAASRERRIPARQRVSVRSARSSRTSCRRWGSGTGSPPIIATRRSRRAGRFRYAHSALSISRRLVSRAIWRSTSASCLMLARVLMFS